MNNVYTMAATQDAKHRSQAMMITAAFAALMVLLMLFLRSKLPVFERLSELPGIEVELNLPPDPPEPEQTSSDDGGGGGGNPVQASGPAGIAAAALPVPGDNQDAKELDEENDKESPAVTKPVVVKPKATAVTTTSVAKVEPKVVETPAPPRPKAVLGKTTTGAGKGGGADDYDRPGGSGNGSGVGDGDGRDGGRGTGSGGGTGPGTGGGSGPKVTRGDRKIVRHYFFQGDLDKAVVYANITVTPDGTGKFVSIAKGSSNSSNAYKQAIVQYLQNIKFDKADHESMLTVQFNFRVN